MTYPAGASSSSPAVADRSVRPGADGDGRFPSGKGSFAAAAADDDNDNDDGG